MSDQTKLFTDLGLPWIQSPGVTPGALPMLVLPAKEPRKTAAEGGCFHGLSSWSSWQKCRRRYDLDKETGIRGADAEIGTLFHRLLEIYYLGKFDQYVISYHNDQDPYWLEACRLFTAYRELFPANEFGKVIACERIINFGTYNWQDRDKMTTEDIEKARECERIFGVPELGGIIDMIVDIDADSLEVLKKSRMFHDGLEPGCYLLDTKTKKQRATDMEIQFFRALQFQLYMMLAETDPTLPPVKGFIANAVIRHKKLEDKKSFVSTIVPPPAEYHRKFVKNNLTRMYRMRQDAIRAGDPSPANIEWCESYAGCPYVNNGMCDRL